MSSERYAHQYQRGPVVVPQRVAVIKPALDKPVLSKFHTSHRAKLHKPVAVVSAAPKAPLQKAVTIKVGVNQPPTLPSNTFFDFKASVPPKPAPSLKKAEPIKPRTVLKAAIEPQDHLKSVKKSKLRFKKPQFALYGLAGLLIGLGGFVALQGLRANQQVAIQAEVLAATSANAETSVGSELPSEKPPSSIDTYQVAPDLPRIISIESVGVKARVLSLGVDENNNVSAPASIYDAGWYNASAKPDDTQGAMLVDGHVSGPSSQGVFYKLGNLKAGDEIVIEQGNHKEVVFEVKKLETKKASQVNMSQMLKSIEPSKLGLNLITCGGNFDSSNNSFDSRVLVFATKK